IYAPSRRTFALRLRPDGTFTVGNDDLLSPGQFMTATVLSDEQQGRQAIYRHLLSETKAQRLSENSLFLAWARPVPVPFAFGSPVRNVGSALLSVPLEFEQTPPDTPLMVPRAFISYRRILPLGPAQPTMEGLDPIEEHLRFQLPLSVLPLKVERVRLFAKVEAPTRRFIVRGRTNSGHIELLSVHNPVDPLRLEIQRADVLRLDEQGGFHLDIAIGEPENIGNPNPPKWTIKSLELEIVGRTLEEP
ncbi:MAG TPA: hypothetical protein VGX70_21375, partial [Gemmataceae bacterium]|nr:hypothetical protein [Gemmataceae bacterium]